MSRQKLIKFVENLLFGGDGSTVTAPPEMLPLVLRLKAKGISISQAMSSGGLVNAQSLLVGDLDRCLEHFERSSAAAEEDVPEPTFQTGTVTRFYNHMTVALARQKSEEAKRGRREAAPPPTDADIFKSILQGDDASRTYEYVSPWYWGELARHLLNDHRSVRGLVPMSSDSIPDSYIRRAVRLYDVTIKTIGRRVDPLTMHLLPDKTRYVDPAHFGSDAALEAFVQLRSDHPLSAAVRRLLHRCVDELLHGNVPSVLDRHEGLEGFITNVLVVHNDLRQVTDEEEPPPRLVDVFQRLLAMTKLDHLWRRDDSLHHPSKDSSASSQQPASVVFGLTTKIHRLEKQNAFLLDHLKQH